MAPIMLPPALTSCSRSFPLEYWPVDYPDYVFLAFLSLSIQVPSVSMLFQMNLTLLSSFLSLCILRHWGRPCGICK